MSRDGGFQVGDRSSRTLYDVRLVRATRKAGLAVIVAWDAIVDASWEAGCRVPFDDAIDTLPYDLGDSVSIKAALTSVGLLEDGLIREDSWASWFGIADERREAKRERDRAYAAARRQRVASESQAVVPSYRPSVPSDRTVLTRASDDATTEKAAAAARKVVEDLRLAQ
jgi:hypothetical protein